MAKDFRNKTFQKVLRGYSPDEVDEYIARINEEYRKTERKMNDTERKLALALEKLDEVSGKYAALAEDNAVYEDRARSVIAEANNKAARIVSEARESAKEIEKKAEKEKSVTINRASFPARFVLHFSFKSVISRLDIGRQAVFQFVVIQPRSHVCQNNSFRL